MTLHPRKEQPPMKYPLLAAALLSLAACGTDDGAQDNGAVAAAADARAGMAEPAEAVAERPDGGPGAPDVPQSSDNPMAARLAEVGGSVAAAVTLCGLDVDHAAFAESKRQQQAHFVQMGGGTGEQFEAAYQAGHDQATARYEAGDRSEERRVGKEWRCGRTRDR